MSVVYLHRSAEPEGIATLLDKMNPEIPCDHVFIKPNIVAPFRRSSGIVTDPEVVRGLIHYLRSRGIARITIGEAPGLGVDVEGAFMTSGFRKLADEVEVDLVDLNKEEVVEVPWSWGTITIPRIVIESFYINVAKLKTHMNTTVSLALKNQKGLLSPGFKKLMHNEGLHSPLVELAKVVRPNLTIIDGIIGLEGDGPCSSGRSITSNVLVASSDILAADSIGCKVMGIDPYQVAHIRLAAEAGIGDMSPDVSGEVLDNVTTVFKRANEEYRRIFRLTQWRNPRACSMCGSELSAAIRRIAKTPRLALTVGPKFAYRFLLGGIDVISGRDATLPQRRSGILCLGKCTRELAEKNGYVWVTGCPPKMDDIIDGFRRL